MVGGVSPQELFELELEMIKTLGFRLSVGRAAFDAYAEDIFGTVGDEPI